MFTNLLYLSLLIGGLAEPKTAPNEFVFGNENEPETIDPHKVSGVPDNNVVTQLFEGLMKNGPDWVTLLPGQAKSIPTPTEGGKRYVFKLREGLKWSDGSPLTAEDFVYSWLRAMRPDTLGPYSYWLTDKIVGAKAYAEKPTPENARKVGVKALDERTLEVRLNKPVPYFLYLTAESIFFPVHRATFEKHGDKWIRPENMVSNGPYTLEKWEIQKRIRLKKNPQYWDAENVQIEYVEAVPITDKQTVLNLFRQGRLDWSGHQGAPNTMVPALRRQEHFRVDPAFITYFYRFNTTKPPLDDKRVRQALSLAIDREALVKKITRGGEQVATALVPPKTGEYVSPQGVVTGNFEEDLKKAKALLADYKKEKGVEKLRTMRLQYDTKELHKRIAQAIQAMWKEHLGVEVEPFNLEWKVYLAAQRNMDFDISRSGWMGDYPDPASFLELFTGTSGNNHTGYSDNDYNKWFADSNRETDPKKRRKILQKLEAKLLEDLPIAPIFYYTNFSFIRPEIKGFEPNLVDRPFVKYMSKTKG